MPPIAIVFFLTGVAVWANALYFLGLADRPAEDGGSNPAKAVGWITLIAGLVDLWQVQLIGQENNLLGGLVVFYGAFFTLLGIVEILGLDLRVVGNVAVAVAVVPLFYWDFLTGTWWLQSNLVVWAVAFLAVAATTWGRFNAKILGLILLGTAIYSFWIPAIILALGEEIP